ncbi:hypothetical protein [Nitrosomonas sp. Nm132]|nr:hypothetical protein [Nitrosomonas sp. Nm132]
MLAKERSGWIKPSIVLCLQEGDSVIHRSLALDANETRRLLTLDFA